MFLPRGLSRVVGAGWFGLGGMSVQLGQWIISFTTEFSLDFGVSDEDVVAVGRFKIGNCWIPSSDGSIITLGNIIKLCGWIPIMLKLTISESLPFSQPSWWWLFDCVSEGFSSSMGPLPDVTWLLNSKWCWALFFESWDDWASNFGRKFIALLPVFGVSRSKM